MRTIVAIVFLMVAGNAAVKAQGIADPTAWTYEVKQESPNIYSLIFHLKLQTGWHIWALKPGGDGFEIPPSFTFTKDSSAFILLGPVKEMGDKISALVPGMPEKVNYFAGKVDFVQQIMVKGKRTIKGTHQYQVCNDNICLPPTDKEFSFEIN
jgi:thiol:disulfide interchange protein DsbD